eukprot:1269665-Amorphochlora_amoeboformis.AAC.1
MLASRASFQSLNPVFKPVSLFDVQIWEALSGKLVNDLRGHSSFVCSVAWSRDGKHMVGESARKYVNLIVDTSSGLGNLRLGVLVGSQMWSELRANSPALEPRRDHTPTKMNE